MRKVWVVSAVALLALGCVVGAGAGFCAATLHVARRSAGRPPGATRVGILAGDQSTSKGWWFRPGSPNGAVCWCCMGSAIRAEARPGSRRCF